MKHWVWCTVGVHNCLNNKNINLHEFFEFWVRDHIFFNHSYCMPAHVSLTFTLVVWHLSDMWHLIDLWHLVQDCLLSVLDISSHQQPTEVSSKQGRISGAFSEILCNHQDKGLDKHSWSVYTVFIACYLLRSSSWLQDCSEKHQKHRNKQTKN